MSDLNTDPIIIAQLWHSGQHSAFYSIGSTGKVFNSDIKELAELECEGITDDIEREAMLAYLQGREFV